MTIELWQACLAQFRSHGTRNEQMMASLLLQLSLIDDPRVAKIFDRYASEILESCP